MTCRRSLLWGVMLLSLMTADGAGAQQTASAFQEHLIDTMRPGLALWPGISAIAFSSTGRRVAYRAVGDRGQLVVVDGQLGEPHALVGNPVFSADGSRIGYAVADSIAPFAPRNAWSIVVDGVERRLDPFYVTRGPVFSADGSVVLFAAMLDRGGPWRIFVGDRPGELVNEVDYPAEYMANWPVAMTRTGSRVVYKAGVARPFFAGAEPLAVGDKYLDVESPVFSPDGSRLAFVAREKAGRFVVVDGRETSRAEEIVGLRFSADGSRLGYAARSARDARIVILGNRGSQVGQFAAGRNSLLDYSDVWLSPSLRSAAFVDWRGYKGRLVVITDGGRRVESEIYDHVSSPVFDGEETQVAFGVRVGNQFWWKVLSLTGR